MIYIKKLYGFFLRVLILLFGIDNAKKFDTRFRFHRKLNLKNPKTLADKVSFIELHNQTDLAVTCTDKWAVREYIIQKGLENILVPTVGGVWNKVEEIDFNQLPEKYVLKATHGCKMNYIVKNKDELDITKCVAEMKKWMSTTYGTYSIEPHYLSIPHRIYAETYLEDLDNLIDYKIHCINGIPSFVLVCSDRKYTGDKGTRVTLDLFDMQWNPILELVPSGMELPGNGDIPMPSMFLEMKEIATILSKDFDFVRVDLYQLKDKILFGELTFSPACCVFPYFSDKFLLEQGEKLIINK